MQQKLYNLKNQVFGNNNQQQMQKQSYVSHQKKTAQTQCIIKQVDDAFEAATIAAEMYQTGTVKDKTVNRLCDGALLALNMLAGTFEELYQNEDKDAILLAKGQAFDLFEALKRKDKDTYNLVEPHRKFINCALNGHPNLAFTSSRARPASSQLRNQNADDLHDAWSTMIKYDQEYDETQQSYLEPKTNKKLAEQHKSKLYQIQNNNKYKEIKKQKKYIRPEQAEFYWTKSGKQSVFVNKKAIKQKEAEEKSINEDVFGAESTAYDTIKPKLRKTYNNTVIQFSKQNPWKCAKNEIVTSPVCGQVLGPSINNPDKTVRVKPCKPYDRVILDVPLSLLILNYKQIKKHEARFIEMYRKLGYPSIESHEDPDGDIEM